MVDSQIFSFDCTSDSSSLLYSLELDELLLYSPTPGSIATIGFLCLIWALVEDVSVDSCFSVEVPGLVRFWAVSSASSLLPVLEI